MPKYACYHKVKARYRVFPSAYASGALAKMQKSWCSQLWQRWQKSQEKAEGGLIEMKNGGSVPKQTRKRKTKIQI